MIHLPGIATRPPVGQHPTQSQRRGQELKSKVVEAEDEPQNRAERGREELRRSMPHRVGVLMEDVRVEGQSHSYQRQQCRRPAEQHRPAAAMNRPEKHGGPEYQDEMRLDRC